MTRTLSNCLFTLLLTGGTLISGCDAVGVEPQEHPESTYLDSEPNSSAHPAEGIVTLLDPKGSSIYFAEGDTTKSEPPPGGSGGG